MLLRLIHAMPLRYSRLGAPLLGVLLSATLHAQVEDQGSADETTADAEAIVAPHPMPTEDSLPLEELKLFADVFNQIRSGYVEEISDSELFELAVQGMLSGLDPHSVYLEKTDYEDLKTTTEGEFSGIGIEIGRERGYIKVIAPIDGSPAAEGGLEAGDVILKIDGESVKEMTIDESVEQLRGPIGSEVILEIGRPGTPQPFDVTLKRDVIKVASVRSRELAPGYLWLRVSQFQRNTGNDLIDLIDAKKAEGEIKGVVIDLRNNPGGVLGASVDIAGAFLDGGLVVYTEGRHPSAADRYEAPAGDILNGAPIVVLINGGSASASEIVAGALQDRQRGIVMGSRSFGKGSVQTILPISENRAVKLTTALYFTPSGRSIQAEGIVPDMLVDRGRYTADFSGPRVSEADLAGSLSARSPHQEEETSEELERLREEDHQLYEALTVLRGFELLSRRDSSQ
ncbi:MAG: S41 family peptidase [Halieaceae bacterium]|jgi:carboxyl-terminal processing protease|nr:S41 family peptidase [Halieaceae bacterium]